MSRQATLLTLVAVLSMEVSSSEQGVYPLLSKPVEVGETRQWGKLLTGVHEVPVEIESSKRLTLASSLERPNIDDFKAETQPIEKSFQFEIVKQPSKTKSDALKIRKILQNLKLDLDKIKSQSQNELKTINNLKDFDDDSESPPKFVKIVQKRSNIPASGDQQRNDLVWATVGNGRVTVLPLSIGPSKKLLKVRKRRINHLPQALTTLESSNSRIISSPGIERHQARETTEKIMVIDMFTHTEKEQALGDHDISLVRYRH